MFNFTYLILPYNIKFIISFLVANPMLAEMKSQVPSDTTYYIKGTKEIESHQKYAHLMSVSDYLSICMF